MSDSELGFLECRSVAVPVVAVHSLDRGVGSFDETLQNPYDNNCRSGRRTGAQVDLIEG